MMEEQVMKDKNGKTIKVNDKVMIFSVKGKVLKINVVKGEPVAECKTLNGVCNAYTEEIQKVG
jgi:hypothetical protein